MKRIFKFCGAGIIFLVFADSVWAGWGIQTVDSEGDVGIYNSITLDGYGNPHICYQQVYYGSYQLKYAKWTGRDWDIQKVEPTGLSYWMSIAVDSLGNPHIAYFDDWSEFYGLRYARWTSGIWNIQTVDSLRVGKTSIAVDSLRNPHISYYDESNGDLKYAKWSGSSWYVVTVDSTGNVGGYNSIALDANNYPHISYYDYTNGDLKFAKWTGSSWLIQVVDSTGDVGAYSSIALDANNYPHISYCDEINHDLKYAKWTGSTWSIQTVDSEITVAYRYGGSATSIGLDSHGYPHIVYWDNWENDDLKFARWTGMVWSIETIDTHHVYGHVSIIVDRSDNSHISYYVGGELHYAKSVTFPRVNEQVTIYLGIFKPMQGEKAYVSYRTNTAGNVSIKVYDSRGNEVRTIFAGVREQGDYCDEWNGRNDDGNMVASGVYLIVIEAPGIKEKRKVVVVK